MNKFEKMISYFYREKENMINDLDNERNNN